jgi:hypothetical protein
MFAVSPGGNGPLARTTAIVLLVLFFAPATILVPKFQRPLLPTRDIPARVYAFDSCEPAAALLRPGNFLHTYRLRIVAPCVIVPRAKAEVYGRDGEITVLLEPRLPYPAASQESNIGGAPRFYMFLNPGTADPLSVPIELGHIRFGTTHVGGPPELHRVIDAYEHLLFLDAYSIAGEVWWLLLIVLYVGAAILVWRLTRQ